MVLTLVRNAVMKRNEDSFPVKSHTRQDLCDLFEPALWRTRISRFVEDGVFIDRSERRVHDLSEYVAVLHIVRKGIYDIRVVPDEQRMSEIQYGSGMSEWRELHDRCLTQNVVLMCGPFDEDWEVCLVPTIELQCGVPVLVFWAYITVKDLVTSILSLTSSEQLAVMIDLDQTLVQSMNLRQLKEAMNESELLRIALDTDDSSVVYPTGFKLPHEHFKAICDAKISDLQFLIGVMETYAFNGYVMNGDDIILPIMEQVYLPSGAKSSELILRFEYHGQKLIMTYLYPGKLESLTLVWIRPGWDDFHGVLATKKFKVYVVTSANDAWGFKAWGLLDPEGLIIPAESVPLQVNICKRLHTVNKFMSRVIMGLHAPVCPYPWAVAIDDRRDVWDLHGLLSLIQVAEFKAYFQKQMLCAAIPSLGFSKSLSSADGPAELNRCGVAIQDLHTHVFKSLRKSCHNLRAAFTVGMQHNPDETPEIYHPKYCAFFSIAEQLKMGDMQVTFKQLHLPMSSYLPRLHAAASHVTPVALNPAPISSLGRVTQSSAVKVKATISVEIKSESASTPPPSQSIKAQETAPARSAANLVQNKRRPPMLGSPSKSIKLDNPPL